MDPFGTITRRTAEACPSGPPRADRLARCALHADAHEATIRLASGREVDALTFDGRSPGPELRVTQGDLVEVTLANEDVDVGVTIHWHGVDVPNARTGSPVSPRTRCYGAPRLPLPRRAVGTFWYHTHQVSSKEVRRGLFGALVIEPRGEPTSDVDETVSRTRSTASRR